jgi:hypothetical protein
MDSRHKKRTCKRRIFNRPVNFEQSANADGLRDDIQMGGDAINISSGGLGLRTTCALKRGEILKLYLPAIARIALLPVISEVVWVRQSGSHVEAGLRFL